MQGEGCHAYTVPRTDCRTPTNHVILNMHGIAGRIFKWLPWGWPRQCFSVSVEHGALTPGVRMVMTSPMMPLPQILADISCLNGDRLAIRLAASHLKLALNADSHLPEPILALQLQLSDNIDTECMLCIAQHRLDLKPYRQSLSSSNR